MVHGLCALASAAIVLNLAVSGVGRAAEPMQVTTYPREFFDGFAPSTALDMVARVPGFTLDQGEARRGFGDTGGNVLINGARPGSKAGGPRDALARIPASAVVRIDLVTNPTTSEASGQTVIVNLILRETSLSGSWGVSVSSNREGDIRPYMEASLSGPVGGWRASGRVQFDAWRDPSDGVRRRTGPAGEPDLFEQESRLADEVEITLSGDARREAFGGELVLNGRVEGEDSNTRFSGPGFLGRAPAGLADQFRGVSFAEDVVEAEFGGEWTRQFPNAWSFKVLSLASWRHEAAASSSRIETPPGIAASETTANSQRTLIEWVGRGTASVDLGGRLRPEFGAEAAFNRLDSALAFASRNASGELTPILLPAANIVVDEQRAEAFVNLAYDVAPRWTLDARAATEWSEISVTGDARNRQRLTFFKPALSLAWRPNPNATLDIGLRRTVGQLDFDAFAASTEVGIDRSLGGNAQLRPQTETRASLDLDFRGREGLALNAGIFHEWREDVLEPVILPGGDFGLGNADRARVWGATVGASASLSWLAPGLRLDARGEWRDSVFEDPLSGQSRPLTALIPWTYSVELRQDLPAHKLSWSIQVDGQDAEVDYFVPEVNVFEIDPEVRMSVESSHFGALKLRFTVYNPLGRRYTNERTFFAPTRAAAITGREYRRWEEGRYFWFTVKNAF
ncbi:TonB-dependent receptor domain-containing protein [Phenylobacterium sp.]|uniref:TonB-dependent receptor domain-containing protein n=1 Tax=Phenylobacterium sp. TaxID=1871053 RepID=UPI0025D92F79|nr:TonB-dependent receptor [Phenylobacterium sp.]MCA6251978.1 TonB-dependent receptor [Phenylobacterium sp.]